MRIRSIKPEFWRSDDITALAREHRLLFIGLWSYVDDNGVGIDDYRQIAADLFALEDDQKEVRDYVREGLAILSRALLVVRYEVEGKRFLYINTWDRHQRVDRPNKARYPRPDPNTPPPTCEDPEPTRTPATPSRNRRETPSTGAVEQGNRGTGEQGRSTGAGAPGTQLAVINGGADIAPAQLTAQQCVGAWHDAYTASHDAKPTARALAQVGREAKQLLNAGNPPERVLLAAQSAARAGYATVETEYRNMARRAATAKPQRRSTTDDRVGAAVALAAEYERESS